MIENGTVKQWTGIDLSSFLAVALTMMKIKFKA